MSSLYRILKYKIGEQWRSASPFFRRGLVAIVAIYLHVYLYSSPLGQVAESTAQTVWYRIRGPLHAPRTVTVVRLDSETFQQIQMPSDGIAPRWIFAEALKKITTAGAKMIVLDFFFIGQDSEHPDSLRLAEALANSPSVIGRSVTARTRVGPDGEKDHGLFFKRPSKQFAVTAKEIVPLQVQAGEDGRVHNITLAESVLEGDDTPAPLLRPLRRFVDPMLKTPGPFDLINYYGPPFSIPNLSLSELLREGHQPSPEYFRDRVVLIGGAMPVAPGKPGKDSFRVPASSTEMYGVEIHATVAANLMDGSWIRKLPPSIELAGITLAAFSSLMLVLSLGPKVGVFATAAVTTLWIVVAYVAFSLFHWSIPGAVWFVILLPAIVCARWVILRRAGAGF